MSFRAILKVDGEESKVLHCSYSFLKITDATGKPTSIPQGGMVKYEFSLNDKGQWVETGQYSPDGQQWYPSFSMLLDKK